MNQHYLPRFYLKNWKVKVKHWDNQIWVYEKGEPPRYCSIQKDIGCAVDFYAFKRRDGLIDNTAIEKRLGLIESRTAPIFAKINDKSRLNKTEKENLAEFISTLWRRVPFHKQHYERQLNDFVPQYFANLHEELQMLGLSENDALVAEILRIEQQYREELPDEFYAQEVLRESVMTKALQEMDWAFISAPRDTKFVTSDNPFIFSRGAGLGSIKYGHALFPISPEMVLQATWKNNFNLSFVQVSEAHAREVNKRIVSNAYQQVFSNKKSVLFANFTTKWMGFELPS